MNQSEQESLESIQRRAYMLGIQLKNSGLDSDIIYARLEKQGIPEEIAQQVAKEIFKQRMDELKKEEEPFYYAALIRIGIGVGIALISIILLPGVTIIPIGLIAGGILAALLTKKN